MGMKNTERAKASRARKRIKQGVNKPGDREYLQWYEAEKRARRRGTSEHSTGAPRAPASASTTQPPTQTGPEREGASQGPARQTGPGTPGAIQHSAPAHEARSEVQQGYVEIPFTSLGEPEKEAPEGANQGNSLALGPGPLRQTPQCNIPDCPACKAEPLGGQICVTTGKRVWPPMSIETASLYAEGLLWIIGQCIRLFRKDKHFVTPSSAEVRALATGLREAQMNRAQLSWLGAGSDVALAFVALQGYGRRAVSEKPPKRISESEESARNALEASPPQTASGRSDDVAPGQGFV